MTTDAALIAAELSAVEREAIMHREGASEGCMSWRTARSLHSLGLTLKAARYLRLTKLGHAVRTVIQTGEMS